MLLTCFGVYLQHHENSKSNCHPKYEQVHVNNAYSCSCNNDQLSFFTVALAFFLSLARAVMKFKCRSFLLYSGHYPSPILPVTNSDCFSMPWIQLPQTPGFSCKTLYTQRSFVLLFTTSMQPRVCLVYDSPSPPLQNIQVMVIVWRLTGNIIRTALCWIV